jgi:hypothetical protein
VILNLNFVERLYVGYQMRTRFYSYNHDRIKQEFRLDDPWRLRGMKNIIVDPLNVDTSASYVSAATASDGSFLVAYIPPAHRGEVKVDLGVLSKPAFVYWSDPTDGRYISVEASPVTNKGIREFMTPGKNHAGESDWVLLLSTSRIKN